jgi:hypothetical protein
MSRHLSIVVAVAFVALTCATTRATVINVDFNAPNSSPPSGTAAVNYSGLGAAPDSGTFWNDFNTGNDGTSHNGTSLTTGSLKASDGLTNTGVTVTLGNYTSQNQLANYGNTGPITVALNLFGDDVYAFGNVSVPPGTFSINNLTNTSSYDLYLYSLGAYPNDNNTTFTINGVTVLVTGDPRNSAVGQAFNDATVDTVGNYVVFHNLTPVGGVISGTFAGTNQRFNGLQLVVPEPSSLALVGIAAAGLITRKRRAR